MLFLNNKLHNSLQRIQLSDLPDAAGLLRQQLSNSDHSFIDLQYIDIPQLVYKIENVLSSDTFAVETAQSFFENIEWLSL